MAAPTEPNDVAAMSPADHVKAEEAAWQAIVADVLGAGAELVSVSRFITDSRTYRAGDKLAKIRRIDPAWPADAGMEVEAGFLRSLGREVDYAQRDGWEISLQEVLPGSTFSSHLFDQQETSFTTKDRMRVLRSLVPELRALHKQGIAHGDLRTDNILVEGDDVRLVDFDRATRTSPRRAALRDWVGIGAGPTPFWKLAAVSLAPKSLTAARRVRYQLVKNRPAAKVAGETRDVAILRDAWHLAEQSAANARGQGLAYYALSYRGSHLSGERAWPLRWDPIAASVDFTGKRVLELGCNMGLLSNFAKMHGAAETHGVDHDHTIVDAAKTVARAFETGCTFEQLDLMGEEKWEERLSGYDMVTALSIVHWLPDRDRVLRFLAQHAELLYEGHDELDDEIALLNSLGFDQVDVVLRTERDRHVLLARRTGS
ncbi:hypothetical protein GCM10022237_33080 [Nocardioides ginsengisoli]|uniref:Methyltransferase domain-containing protein n=1 Tax=Nocardioides ginsengisoli TaxID=363868 RepID=A0ABW3W453_9ACTN